MNDTFRVGVVTNTHGLKGEIKVFPTTEDIRRFDVLPEVLIEGGDGLCSYAVEQARYSKNLVILKLAGIDSIEAAEAIKGKDLMVSRENAIPLEEGEFYIADALGLPVFDEHGTQIGTLKEIFPTGANDVYVVKRAGKKDLLLPGIPQCVKKVDVEAGRIDVVVLDGLEDL